MFAASASQWPVFVCELWGSFLTLYVKVIIWVMLASQNILTMTWGHVVLAGMLYHIIYHVRFGPNFIIKNKNCSTIYQIVCWPICVVQPVVKFRSMHYSYTIDVHRSTMKHIKFKCRYIPNENICFTKRVFFFFLSCWTHLSARATVNKSQQRKY